MTLRQLPGALGTGLLASLLAHAASFGDGHAQGGPFHIAFVSLGWAAVVGFLMAAAWTALCASKHRQSGSLLAARLAVFVPNRGAVIVSSAAWFVLGESLEPPHAPASLLAIALSVAVFALLLRALAFSVLTAIAAIAVAIEELDFLPRLPVWAALRPQPVRRPASVHLQRRRGRAPPVVMTR
jgi:hypothetical protein